MRFYRVLWLRTATFTGKRGRDHLDAAEVMNYHGDYQGTWVPSCALYSAEGLNPKPGSILRKFLQVLSHIASTSPPDQGP